jgi:hypothetical protein
MAERARGSAKPRKAAKAKAKSNGVGHNSGGVPDEVRQRWWDKIDQLAKALDRAKVPYDSAKGKLQQAYGAAEEDGVDVNALRAARKAQKQDRAVFAHTYVETGRFLRLINSPLADPEQLNLFPDPGWPEPVNANLAGYVVGKAGGPIDDNPHTPGTESFAQWRTGHELGVDDLKQQLS